MKKLLLSLIGLFFITFSFSQTYTNPVGAGINAVADPYIMQYNGTYYLYGTTSNDGFKYWTSTDMVNWTSGGYAFQETPTSYGDNTYWAAEVKHYNGKFYMTYSCKGKNGANGGNMLLCLAQSNSPTGPFTDLYAPWFNEGYSCIDADIFIDTDGEPYLYFDIVGSTGYVYGNIYMRKLNKTDLTIAAVRDTVFCSRATQAWESPNSNVNRTNEGAFVFKYLNKYFMTYSANSWDNPNYGIGYQTADSPYGPWTKSIQNPIVAKDSINGIFGPGHNSFTYSPDGKELFIAYHSQISYTNKGRQLNIDRAYIDDQYNLTIFGPTRTPQLYPTIANSVISVKTTGVTLNPTSASLIVGTSTAKLTATVSPLNATLNMVSWSSDNTNVAIVSYTGLVTPVGYGTANITARTYDGGKTATCVVTVDTISVTSVTVNPTTLAFNIKGITSTLTATILPTNASFKTLIWSSSNTAIATVSTSGVVTPIGDGIATITVTSFDGLIKDTCSVSVSISPLITVNTTSLDFGDVAINSISPEKTFTIKGSNLSSAVTINAPIGYEISRSSGTGFGTSLTLASGILATIKTIYVRFKPTAVQTYSGNITNVSTGITQNISVTGTGVNSSNLLNSIQDDVSIYPNPAKDQVIINLKSFINGKINISIINSLGIAVKDENFLIDNNVPIIFDIKNLTAGLYYISINYNQSVSTIKFLIQ